MKVSRIDEMRDMDRRAIEEYGISDELLMENAGQAAYFVLMEEFGIRGKNFAVVCGVGNNGGDGLVVARKIHSQGGRARVFILGDPKKYHGAARSNFDIISRLPVEVIPVTSGDMLREPLKDCDAVVDAVFGTGLVREVGGVYREAIRLINLCGRPVLSIDIASGINGDTGQIMGEAVSAEWTVTYGLPKIGNLLFPGFLQGGKLYVSHISFPPALYDRSDILVEINRPDTIPSRNPSGHKGDFGDVLFIAGAASYLGAPYFSALSFLKAGGGYSRLATPAGLAPFIAGRGSEIVFAPLLETPAGSIARENKSIILELAANVDMVILGPGISLNQETQELVRELTAELPLPLLLDGDGITAVAKDMDVLKKRTFPTVLTPHSGEMARMIGGSVSEVDEHKIDVLRDTAREYGVTVVLKGAHSLIGSPDGRIFINTSGNSGMATAGSGDILTGTIAAMFGQGLPLERAVRNGVFLHGLAGDFAAGDLGEDGMTAHDVMDNLPAAVAYFREHEEELLSHFHHSIYFV